MKWCILITTYNRCSLVERAINSALMQTLPCEIVVIDDASQDETVEYLESLGNSLKFKHNLYNLGHSACVNQGVSLAEADWIKLLDDDDYLAPNCLEMLDQAIIKYPRSVIASVQGIQVDENDQEISKTTKVGHDIITYVPQSNIHYQMLIERLPFGTPAQVAFQKQAFLLSGGWNSQFDLHYDDIDSWVRIAQFGDAVFINQCLAYRYVWPGGYNQKIPIEKRLNTNLLIKEKIYDLIDKKYEPVLPSLRTIKDYLKLYWGLVALRNLKFLTFLKLIFPSALSFKAWVILLNAIL